MRCTVQLMLLLLVLAMCVSARGPFAWKDLGDGRIELREAGKLALVYNYGPQLKLGAPQNKRRCCYFFPVLTPAEVSMLDDFPTDHWHHRGLFWSWPIVQTGGQSYDIWMNFTAKYRTVKPPVVTAGKDANFAVEDVWEAGGKDIVRWCLRATTSQPSQRDLGDGRYGFIGASFPGRTATVNSYTLEPGKPWTVRFRVRFTDLP